MKKDIIGEQIKIYRPNFIKYGDKPQGIFWNDAETQYLRYERLLRNFALPKKNFSIHDIGSGVCDLHKYLLEQRIEHDYIGTEIVPEMIEVSKQKYPNIRIFNRDIVNDNNVEKCDIVVLSGTLNLPGDIDPTDWKEFSFRLIRKMFSISNWGIAFNFLTTYGTFSEKMLVYFDPCQLFDFCMRKLSRFVTIDHGYPLYEGTVTVLHEHYVKQQFPGVVFDKYWM
jgi:hypothetical protein